MWVKCAAACCGAEQDLHPPQLVSAVQAFCSTTLQLQPLSDLQKHLINTATGRACHGQLAASSKRLRVGRLKVQQQLYALLPGGGVDVFAAPDEIMMTPQMLVQTGLVTQPPQAAATAGASSGLPGSRAVPASTVSRMAGGTRAPQQQLQQQAATGGAVEVAQDAEDGMFKKFASSMRLEMSAQVGCLHSSAVLYVVCVV